MPKIVVKKTRNANTLTESQYFSKIRSSLRNGFRWWKPMTIALDKASRPYKGKNKLQKKEYICAHCEQWFKRKEVQIDHIEECGSLRSYDDIVPFIIRLTNENIDGYQILCKNCHKEKTKDERNRRKENCSN